jgi:CBS domain-containing protein
MATAPAVKSKVEKWVMCRSAHLGVARDSFSPGTVIEHLVDEGVIVIEGKRYESDRDLIALKALVKKTGFAWIVPFSAKAAEAARKNPSSLAKDKPPLADEGHDKMPVVKSDADELGDIDISSTKNRPHAKKEDKKLEVVKGDESAAERLARLQAEGIPKMPIVRDDSLGEVGGPTRTGGVVKTPPPDKAGRREPKPITAKPEVKTNPVDTEALPSETEVHPVPPVAASAAQPVKRGPGRPRKAKQVPAAGGSANGKV